MAGPGAGELRLTLEAGRFTRYVVRGVGDQTDASSLLEATPALFARLIRDLERVQDLEMKNAPSVSSGR
jgi:hypothetical protein